MVLRQTIYDRITRKSPKSKIQKLYEPYLMVLGILVLLQLLFRLICCCPPLVEFIIEHITTPVKHTIAKACGVFPFSPSELIWTVAVIGLAGYVVWSLVVVIRSLIYRLQGRSTHPLRRFLRRLLVLCSVLLVIYSGYCMNWGINYYGETFSQKSGLTGRKSTSEELYALTNAFAERCNELSELVYRDGDGVCSMDVDALFQRTEGMYDKLYDEFPCLDWKEVPARPMFYSKVISYLGFTGFYFPFTGESLVNVDEPDAFIPATILHELAHQRNVAPEDECNFLAILVGMKSGDCEFQYSSALLAYIHLSNALYSADYDLWLNVRNQLNEAVRCDLDANNAYWDRFSTPAADAAETIYTNFAESFEQKDIMKSYGACVDLLAAYFLP